MADDARNDLEAARESLFEAIRRGDEAKDEASQAAAWIALVAVEAAGLRQPTEALRWAKHAEVALAHAGGDQEQQGQLLHNIAAALRRLDRDAEALDHERRALSLFEHAFGPRHVRVANQRGSVATSLRRNGNLDEAIREGEAALALLRELVGERHHSQPPHATRCCPTARTSSTSRPISSGEVVARLGDVRMRAYRARDPDVPG